MAVLLVSVLVLASLLVAAHLSRTTLVRYLYGERITKEVRALFGADAEITRVEIDSRWRLVLAGKRLRIPGDLTLDVTEARLRGIGRPESIVVESIEGVLAWRRLRAPVSYRVQENPTAPVHGTLTARGATWREGAPHFDFEGTLRVAKNDYAVAALRVTCDGGAGSGELAGTDGPPTTVLRAEKIKAAIFTHLVSLLVDDHPLTAPAKAEVSGELRIEPDFTRRLDLRLATPSSDVLLAARVSKEGKLDGTKLTGTLSFEDALEAGVFTTRIRPRPVGSSTLDLELRGTTEKPALSGSVRAPSVELEAGPVSIPVSDARCTIELDERGLRWSALETIFGGGRVGGSGVIDANGHTSDIHLEAVRVEDLPVGLDDPLLRGLASGTLSVRGKGDETENLEGEGVIEVAEPEYRFLRGASEPLRAFGLPGLPLRGTAPLRARIQLTGGRIVLRAIQGSVEGMRFEGTIELSWKKRLAGRIEVHLEQRYLAKSLVLALPAVFTGQVTVPLEISGEVGAPRYAADLVGTLGRLVVDNSVTGAITGLVDGLLGNLLGGERRDDDKRRPKRGGLDDFLDALTG